MTWCPLGTQSLTETIYCLIRHQKVSLGCNNLTTVATTDPWASLHCPKPTATYFLKTSLSSLDHLLCVTCGPQSPITTSPKYLIWSPLSTPFSPTQMVLSPMLIQFSPVQTANVQCSPNSHQFKLSKSNAHPILTSLNCQSPMFNPILTSWNS